MHSINELSNNEIKEIIKLHQKKYRDEKSLFLAEGEKALEEFLNSDTEICKIIAINGYKPPKNDIKITYTAENVMKKISTTSTPCDVLTIAKKKNYDIKNFVKLKRIALLDSINDPGNLGTIIRSAAAFGIDGIILFGNCTDLYSSKVIRSTAGNFFKIPIINIRNIEELKKYFQNYSFIATTLSKENNISISDCNKEEKFIVMFGSEAKGLCSELINITDKNIKLEMDNNVESVNLSVCASIIFYTLNL